MALGLNLIVGFAGLLDLGYVAFYAFGATVVGWWASDHFTGVDGDKGVHVGVSSFVESLPGIHLNFLLLLIGAMIVCAIAGAIIGLPTLRLRGDYIAIVTLAFGEIVGRFMQNGDEITIHGYALSNGRESISPLDQIDLPFRRAIRHGHEPQALLLDHAGDRAGRAVREHAAARLAPRPGLDRPARGRGGGREHGRRRS